MKDILSLLLLIALAAIVYPFAAVAVKTGTRSIAWNSAVATAPAGMARLLAHNGQLARILRDDYVPPGVAGSEAGRIVGFNASLFEQANFSEELTGYAVGYRDPNNLEATLEFIAPETPAPRRFEYATFSSPEEFYSGNVDDDLRAIGGDFPTLQYKSDKVLGKLENRGLAIELDEDQIADMPNWQEHYTAKLTRHLNRLAVRRAFALLSAASTNTAKTWSTAAGKNPDGDVRAELIAAATVSGIRPNRILYGDTAWDTRAASHEAQDTAGGYAAAGRTPEQLAAHLTVDGVLVSKERYAATKTAATLAEIVATKVIMFNAMAGADMEDPSNIKRFTGRVSAQNGGGKLAVHLRQVGDKRWRLGIEKYELIDITSTLGIRQFTVAAS